MLPVRGPQVPINAVTVHVGTGPNVSGTAQVDAVSSNRIQNLTEVRRQPQVIGHEKSVCASSKEITSALHAPSVWASLKGVAIEFSFDGTFGHAHGIKCPPLR